MAEYVLKYAEYFSVGMGVEVEIPLADGKQLRDGARIVSAHRDLLELQLSKHISPESVILEMGTDLFLRGGEKGEGYRCRAIFLRCDSLSRLHVRLTGDILHFNEREFFRVDVYIPLSYYPYSQPGRRGVGDESADNPPEMPQSSEIRAGMDADPNKPFPVAANLSGAGVRINIPECFGIDELLELTLYLPFGDSRMMTLVGQVVHVIELSRPGDPHPLFGTALRFVSMDDHHREALIRFIQRVQTEELKRLREDSLRRAAIPEESGTEPIFSRRRVVRMLLALISLLLFAGFVQFLDNYRHHRSKGEIERTFEEQIRKYIERR
jgi:hypothetical protein